MTEFKVSLIFRTFAVLIEDWQKLHISPEKCLQIKNSLKVHTGVYIFHRKVCTPHPLNWRPTKKKMVLIFELNIMFSLLLHILTNFNDFGEKCEKFSGFSKMFWILGENMVFSLIFLIFSYPLFYVTLKNSSFSPNSFWGMFPSPWGAQIGTYRTLYGFKI